MKIVIHPEYSHIADFIQKLPLTFDRLEGELLYQGRNTVKRFRVDGLSLVVKKYKHPNIIQRITYTFFKSSKPERAYRFAGLLRSKHIDSPHEVAYIETGSHCLFSIGYFVSLNCDFPATGTLLNVDNIHHPIADALAGFLVELHEKGVLHGDLNLSNILYHVDEAGAYHFVLIDTNRSVFKYPTQSECLDNLKRLTHKRDLLVHLISLYAQKRGWDAQTCVQCVSHQLDRFEDQRRLKRKFQDLIGIRHG